MPPCARRTPAHKSHLWARVTGHAAPPVLSVDPGLGEPEPERLGPAITFDGVRHDRNEDRRTVHDVDVDVLQPLVAPDQFSAGVLLYVLLPVQDVASESRPAQNRM